MAGVLVLLRHAKAISPVGLADLDRPLSDRGRRDAAAAGEHLRGMGLTPDQVACSPSVRTRQTFANLGLSAPVDFDRRIYDNDPESVLAVIAEQPDDARTLLVIGHNPSMHELCTMLSGTEPERFPTSALAVIEVDAAWSDLSGPGHLVDLWTPKG